MGQLVVGAAGAAIGSYFGPVGASIGFAVGSLIGSFLFPAAGPKLPDISIASQAWGQPIPILYGTARMAGALIWSDSAYWNNTGGGGKGIGGKGNSNGPQAIVSFAMGFCEGPISTILQVYADSKLIYDATGVGPVSYGYNFTAYYGTETQLPDPNIAKWVRENISSAPNACPAYRGLCYLVFPNFDLSDFGQRIPSISIVCSSAEASYIPGQQFTSLSTTVNQGDQLAADTTRGLLYALDPTWGLHVYNLQTLQELTSVNVTTLTSGLAAGTVEAKMACVAGGDIFITDGQVSNSDRVIKILGDSLTYGGSIGSDGSGLSWSTSGQVPDLSKIWAFTAPGNTQVVMGVDEVGGAWGAFNGTTMTYMWGDQSQPDYVPFEFQFGELVQGAVTLASTQVWAVNSGGTNMNFYQILLTGAEPGDLSISLSSTLQSSAIFAGSTSTITVRSVFYDTTDDTLIVGVALSGYSRDYVIKVNQYTGTVIWVCPQTLASGWDSVNAQAALTEGRLGLPLDNDYMMVISTVDGSVQLNLPVQNDAFPSDPSFYLYDSITNSAVGSAGGEVYELFLGRAQQTPGLLSQTIADICTRAGMTSAQFDVSQITTSVQGYVISRNSAAKDCLAQLSQAFFFDAVESGGVLRFIPRGLASPVATLTQDDLGSVGKPEDGDYWEHTRVQQQEVPLQVNIKFKDQNNRYQTNAAYAKRLSAPNAAVQARKKLDVELPMSMDLDTATSIAQSWLYTIWMERDTYGTKTGPQYLYLDPTDSVTVNLNDGSSYIVRIRDQQIGADLSIKWTFEGEDQSTYSYAVEGLNTVSPYNQTISYPTSARLLAMNVPLLKDMDDTGGSASRVYYGAGPYGLGYAPSFFYLSFDNENWLQFDTISNPLTWGTALSTLGSTSSPDATDRVNTLTLSLVAINNPLQSDSQINVLNGTNMALVGQEIIQFQNVAINGDGTYTLSTLFRGCRGTEWAVGTHVAGELFILLDNNVHDNTIALSNLNVAVSAKLVATATPITDVASSSVTFKGYDLKPYSPVNFSTTTSGDGVVVNWVRRTRYGGNLMDGVGTVPIGEEMEAYDLYLLSAPYDPVASNWQTPTTGVVRSALGLTSPYFPYTNDQMTADGYNPATDVLHVVVFQNSAAIGHGWPGSADLAPPG